MTRLGDLFPNQATPDDLVSASTRDPVLDTVVTKRESDSFRTLAALAYQTDPVLTESALSALGEHNLIFSLKVADGIRREAQKESEAKKPASP